MTDDWRLTTAYPPYSLAITKPNPICRPPNPTAIIHAPQFGGSARAMAPAVMKHRPISGTMRAASAPPDATAVPYSSSQQPGSRAVRPCCVKTTVSTTPATSGGMYASAKRLAGPVASGVLDRRALSAMAARPIAAATPASASHTVSHRAEPSDGPAAADAASAVTP